MNFNKLSSLNYKNDDNNLFYVESGNMFIKLESVNTKLEFVGVSQVNQISEGGEKGCAVNGITTLLNNGNEQIFESNVVFIDSLKTNTNTVDYKTVTFQTKTKKSISGYILPVIVDIICDSILYALIVVLLLFGINNVLKFKEIVFNLILLNDEMDDLILKYKLITNPQFKQAYVDIKKLEAFHDLMYLFNSTVMDLLYLDSSKDENEYKENLKKQKESIIQKQIKISNILINKNEIFINYDEDKLNDLRGTSQEISRIPNYTYTDIIEHNLLVNLIDQISNDIVIYLEMNTKNDFDKTILNRANEDISKFHSLQKSSSLILDKIKAFKTNVSNFEMKSKPLDFEKEKDNPSVLYNHIINTISTTYKLIDLKKVKENYDFLKNHNGLLSFISDNSIFESLYKNYTADMYNSVNYFLFEKMKDSCVGIAMQTARPGEYFDVNLSKLPITNLSSICMGIFQYLNKKV